MVVQAESIVFPKRNRLISHSNISIKGQGVRIMELVSYRENGLNYLLWTLWFKNDKTKSGNTQLYETPSDKYNV